METSFLRKTQNAPTIWSFYFTKPPALAWQAGDYVELSLPQAGTHGDRRWASIATSPTEPELMFTFRITEPPSEYKQTLLRLSEGEKAQISPPMGSFNLPTDPGEKLLFVAAGVGITPYRAMLQYLSDTDDARDISLIYVAKKTDYIFGDVLAAAHIPIIQTSDRIDFAWLKKRVADISERIVYFAGTQSLCEKLYNGALAAGLPRPQLRLCYFEGSPTDLSA
jgi:ferredoxin-NADP reductase